MNAIEFYSIVVPGFVGFTTSVWIITRFLDLRYDGDPVVGDPVLFHKLDVLYADAWVLRDAKHVDKVREGTAIINAVGKLMAENRLSRYQQRVAKNTIQQALAHM